MANLSFWENKHYYTTKNYLQNLINYQIQFKGVSHDGGLHCYNFQNVEIDPIFAKKLSKKLMGGELPPPKKSEIGIK